MIVHLLFLIYGKQFPYIDAKTHQHNLSDNVFHSSSSKSDIAHVLFQLAEGSFRLDGTVHSDLDSSDTEKIFSGFLLIFFFFDRQFGKPVIQIPSLCLFPAFVFIWTLKASMKTIQSGMFCTRDPA